MTCEPYRDGTTHVIFEPMDFITYDSHGRLDTMTYPQNVTGQRFKAKYAYLNGYAQNVIWDTGGGTGPAIYAVGDASGGGAIRAGAAIRKSRATRASSSIGRRVLHIALRPPTARLARLTGAR